MNSTRFSKRMLPVVVALAAVAAGQVLPASAQEFRAGASASAGFQAQAGVEVQMRGPVHEAFAEVITYEPSPGIVVPKEPPAVIDELPPEQKPEGDNVVWVAGYWSWEVERDDFLWVSGVWRVLPPERQFVPGYWASVSGGWQWVSGYWVETAVEEVEYIVDAPPKTLEVGANVPPPTTSHVWVPGCWVWRTSRYLWRPGYYVESRPGWIWTPGRYVWTPGGYLYVDGYWDFDIEMRGVLFAPVHFERPVYTHVGYYYSPSVVVDLALITDHLFVRPTFHHYFFGDFYAAHYSVEGCLPWFSFHTSHYGYDPIYAHHRVHHMSVDHDWETRLHASFDFRVSHFEARPLQTFSAHAGFVASSGGAAERSVVLGKTLTQVVESKKSPLRFERLDKAVRREVASHGKAVQKFRGERMRLETAAVSKKGPSGSSRGKALKIRLPESPVSRKAIAKIDRARGGPSRLKIRGSGKPTGGASVDRGGRGGPTLAAPRGKTEPSRGGRSLKLETGRGKPDRGPTSVSPKGKPDRGSPMLAAPPVKTNTSRGGSSKPKTGREAPDRGPTSVSPKGKPDTGASPKGRGRQIIPPAGSTDPGKTAPKTRDKPSSGDAKKSPPKPDRIAPKDKSGSGAPKAPPRSTKGGPTHGGEPTKGKGSGPSKGKGKH